MANPIAGWYPDPSGDASKLRYWDGNQWSDNFMDRPPVQEADPAQEAATVIEEDVVAYSVPEQANAAEASSDFPQGQAVPQGGSPQGQQSAPGYIPQDQQVPQGSVQQPYAAQPGYAAQPQPVQATVEPVYALSSEDRTLRLIAFIFAIVATVSVGWLLFPLAWMIPMSVHCWSLYKGKKPNTVAFGVCTLIFVSLVSGILLLVSTKEE